MVAPGAPAADRARGEPAEAVGLQPLGVEIELLVVVHRPPPACFLSPTAL